MNTDRDELFRLGVIVLKGQSRWKIHEIAKGCDASARHIQGFLSDRERKGISLELKQKIADFFQMTVEQVRICGETGELPLSTSTQTPITQTVSNQGIATAAGHTNRTVIGHDIATERTLKLSLAEEYLIDLLRKKDKEGTLIQQYIADILSK